MVSLVIRRTHMFLALFLVPWVLVYAISTIVMNHRAERGRAEFTVVEERPYSVEYSPDEERNEVASRIMADLDLEGKHGVWGTLEDGSIGIHRHRALKDLLVKIDLKESELVIEESDFSIVRFLNNMHRRRGYNLDYFQDDAWSFSVDLFIIGMIFWALSGLWMWWELKVTRRWGSIVMGSGVALFALFLLTI